MPKYTVSVSVEIECETEDEAQDLAPPMLQDQIDGQFFFVEEDSAEAEPAPDAIRQALAPILQKTRGQPPFDEWPATGCQIYLTREQLDAIRALYDSAETEGNPS
jgi:hypothetical protein